MKAVFEHHPPREEFASFIGSFPHATFFQTPAWLDSLEAAYGSFNAEWLTVRESGALVGAMPVIRVARGPFSSLWSLPFGTYGDPLAREGAAAGSLLSAFFGAARSTAVLEAGVNLFRGERGLSIPEHARVRSQECMIVSLEGGFEAVWKAWRRGHRQCVRRAEDAGISVRLLESEGEVRRFHELYVEESRPWGGVHPYPLALFLELFARRSEGVFIWGAFREDELLGAHIDFYFGEMVQAWQGGMSRRANELDAGPLIHKRAMEEACARGFRSFNLGSSG